MTPFFPLYKTSGNEKIFSATAALWAYIPGGKTYLDIGQTLGCNTMFECAAHSIKLPPLWTYECDGISLLITLCYLTSCQSKPVRDFCVVFEEVSCHVIRGPGVWDFTGTCGSWELCSLPTARRKTGISVVKFARNWTTSMILEEDPEPNTR